MWYQFRRKFLYGRRKHEGEREGMVRTTSRMVSEHKKIEWPTWHRCQRRLIELYTSHLAKVWKKANKTHWTFPPAISCIFNPEVLGRPPCQSTSRRFLWLLDLHPNLFVNIMKYLLKNKTIVSIGDLMLLFKENLSIHVEKVVIVANQF